ncbi:MAG: TonB-dependent receptor [Agriterribacter sp.]
MKCTTVLLLIGSLQVSAKSLGQKVSFSVQNAPLTKIFKAIENQTDYGFFFDHGLLKNTRPVTITLRNIDLTDALNACFADQPVTYEIAGKNIVIKRRQETTFSEQPPKSDPVKGKIVDENGNPLEGASIVVKETKTGTQTDAAGNFVLQAEKGQTLVISYVGFQLREIKLTNALMNNLVVSLKQESEGTNEVVVIAYGEVRKKDLTGSISQVKSKEINAFPTNNILQSLNGRATGVRVTQNNGSPGSPISVRIRGANSILGGNEPLYVVDGFPGTSPNLLQSADIESIEILKDASSISMYGSRGANGVVLITTKSGKKGDRSSVSFESGYSLQQVSKKMKLLNNRQYAELYNLQATNDGLTPYFTTSQVDSLAGLPQTDWQDLVLHKAPMYSNNLSVSGAIDKTRFSLSAGAFLQDGIVRRTNYNRYSLRTNVIHDISKIFNVSMNTTLTRTDRHLQSSDRGNRGSDVFSGMLMAPPTLSPYNADGSYRLLTTAYPFISNALANPLVLINRYDDRSKDDRLLANLAFTIKPVKGLSVKFSGGVDNDNLRSDLYRMIEPSTSSQGTAGISTSQYTNLISENIANYNKSFGEKHTVGITAGFAYQAATTTTVSASGNGFLSDVTNTGNLQGASTPGIPTSSYSKDVLSSYISRINYAYDDKYLLTVSFRRDGSSRYSAGNKWENFPAAALAWRLSKEPFMEGVKQISDLKLRGSYGKTGSNSLSPYQTLNTLSTFNTIFGDALAIGFGPSSTLPGNLRWETTNQLDVGLDLGVLESRIRFTADYYHKKTSNLLNQVQLPSSTGYTTTVQNVGEIENKGWEFAADADVVRKKDLKWTVSANISFNKNKVLKLYNDQDIPGISINTGGLTDYVNILRPGQPMGMFYGYLETGYTATGNIAYLDRNKDSLINAADKTIIGDPNPKFIYGFNSVLSYKQFEFSLFLQGSQGNDIFNLNKASTLDLGMGLNQPQDIMGNYWEPGKVNPKYPRISRSLNGSMSNRFIEDGSYLRFKNIQLAYAVPAEKLSWKWLKSAQIYVSGQNLITITKYSWFDPEVNAYGSSTSITQGIDYAIYPNSKSVTFGIRCVF